MKINKILLMGNPNVGKSAIFSRLVGAKVVISNYPGSTVEFTQGNLKIGDERPMLIDVPGTYTLEPTSRAEEVAVHMLNEGDLIINVIDATNLERNLYLTLELIERGARVIVALNMWDETKHQGITIDLEGLKRELKVPIVPTCGLTGEGIKELVNSLPKVETLKTHVTSDAKRWERIGRIVEKVQRLSHHHHTPLQKLEELSIKPQTGLPIALGVIYCAFLVIRSIGEGLINFVFNPLFDNLWLPLMTRASAFLGSGTFLHNILIGNLIDGKIDFGQSFGLLTTGFYVPIAMVLPYIASFYLVLGVLEDFGYLPRFAVLLDNIMHRFGLHGYAIIPFTLGLGCNVPGALAMRLLESRREKFIAATMMAVAVPCMAQIAMIVGVVGKRGGEYVALVFGIIFIVFIIKGLILNKLLKGSSPEIVLEIPPYRIPQLTAVISKLWMRLCAFLREAVPYVLLGILFVNILNALNIIDFFARLFGPVMTKLWGLPKEAVSALVIGFLRKDVAIGMLGPLNMTTKQLVIGSTILAIYFPCIATFVVLIRELGIKDMLKSAAIMIMVALLVGSILNIIL